MQQRMPASSSSRGAAGASMVAQGAACRSHAGRCGQHRSRGVQVTWAVVSVILLHAVWM